MRADPFEDGDASAHSLFCERLHEVITQKRYHMHISAEEEAGPQITDRMIANKGYGCEKTVCYLFGRSCGEPACVVFFQGS